MFRDTHELLVSTPEAQSVSALVALMNELASKTGEFVTLAATQTTPLTGKLVDRDRSSAIALKAALGVAGPGISYANARHLGDLVAKLSLTRTEFYYTRLELRLERLEQIHDALLPVVAELEPYGVKPAQLTDLKEKIEDAKACLRLPRTTSVTKIAATQGLAEKEREIDRLLVEQIDPVVVPLRQANPAFDALYATARTVVDRSGSRGAAPADAPPATPTPVVPATS